MQIQPLTPSPLLALLPTILAQGRSDTVKQGLRIVGNHYHDKAADSRKAANHNFNSGDGLSVGRHNAAADRHKSVNHQLAGTVNGVRKSRARRSLDDEDGLVLLGRDDSHEYFKRELPELEARWADAEPEELYLEDLYY